MALPQQDDYIEQIHRLDGLMAYAEAHEDWDELERLKGNRPLRGFATHREANTPSEASAERLKKLLEQMA